MFYKYTTYENGYLVANSGGDISLIIILSYDSLPPRPLLLAELREFQKEDKALLLPAFGPHRQGLLLSCLQGQGRQHGYHSNNQDETVAIKAIDMKGVKDSVSRQMLDCEI